MQKNCVILLSGGIDSFAMAHFLVSQERKILPLFVDYGQPSSANERKACLEISKYFNSPLKEITVADLLIPTSGEIRARNLLLISLAAMTSYNTASEIGIGIHTGTPYYDCNEEFFIECKHLLAGYPNPTISLIAPLITWTKSQIIKYASDEKLPLDITYSCEKGENPPCGMCLSCLDRENL